MKPQKRKQLDSNTSAPPTSNPKAPKAPRINNTEKAKHFFTEEEDKHLASIISEDDINQVLQGTGERNQGAPPKSKIYQDIANEFNTKYGYSLDGTKIKNKITHMQKVWKEIRKFRDATGNGDDNDDDEALRKKVLKRCSYYYIVDPVWSALRSSAPRKIIDSTADLAEDIDPPAESQLPLLDIDSDEDEFIITDEDEIITDEDEIITDDPSSYSPENTPVSNKDSQKKQQPQSVQQTKQKPTKSQVEMLMTGLDYTRVLSEYTVLQQKMVKRVTSTNAEITKQEELRLKQDELRLKQDELRFKQEELQLKQEELRTQLEVQKEITKQNELKLKTEQATCERLRLEAQAKSNMEAQDS